MSWRDTLAGEMPNLSGKRMTVGFDGFIDRIVRPLRPADVSGEPAKPFATIREFGEYLIDKAEKSCSIELHEQARQLGGNMPFLSRAAGGLRSTTAHYNSTGKQLHIEFACGYSVSTDFKECNLKILFEKADRRMYEQKNEMKNKLSKKLTFSRQTVF